MRACAQDDRCLRTIALLVNTPGYNKLMMSKSDAEQLSVEIRTDAEEARKQQKQMEEHARMLEEQNKLASEREKQLQEQARNLQEQTEQIRKLREQVVAALEARDEQCQLVKALQIELDTTNSELATNGPGNDSKKVR